MHRITSHPQAGWLAGWTGPSTNKTEKKVSGAASGEEEEEAEEAETCQQQQQHQHQVVTSGGKVHVNVSNKKKVEEEVFPIGAGDSKRRKLGSHLDSTAQLKTMVRSVLMSMSMSALLYKSGPIVVDGSVLRCG